MVIRRVGPLSLARVAGVLYALMGLLFGAILSAISVVEGGFAALGGSGFDGILFGTFAVVTLPIFYGVLGFVVALIVAATYNVVAGWIGGIEIEVG